MKYSIKNFRQDFPDDKTCLAFIFKNRYPKGLTCPKCGRASFVPVEGRRSYACACGYQVYPTESYSMKEVRMGDSRYKSILI